MAKVQAPALILAPPPTGSSTRPTLANSRHASRRRLLDVAGGHLAIFEDYRQIPAVLPEFLAIY
jgi:hypothetical protein